MILSCWVHQNPRILSQSPERRVCRHSLCEALRKKNAVGSAVGCARIAGKRRKSMEEWMNPDATGKMLRYGIETLTDVELLALFLRTGTRGKTVLRWQRAARTFWFAVRPADRRPGAV
jgi:hypothetical protein